jgi:hypothetical protein
MPINWLLKDGRYTPQQIELLNSAFNHALYLLSVVDRNDPLCAMVARNVIEVCKAGTKEPRKIAETAVALMSIRQTGNHFKTASRAILAAVRSELL